MRTHVVLGGLLLATLSALATGGSHAQSGNERSKPTSDKCVSVREEAIYGAYGYDHHVHLHNGCDKPMKCKITSSANPAGVEQALIADEKRDVMLFRGSPASEVSASVQCEPAK
jgi:hypothetical protein